MSDPPTTPKPATQRSSKHNYEQLPEAFRPPRKRKTGLRDGGEPLIQLLPVPTLPRGLLPKVGFHYQPPRFYYGWPCGMARLQELREVHPDIISLFRSSDVIDVPIVIGNIKRYTAKNLEITSFVPHFSPIADPALYGLALADSYFVGCKRPPQADVKKFQQWLGIKEDPLWYLDGTKNCASWGYSHVSRDGDRYALRGQGPS
ncbi:hypothetical protein Hypma_013953 [Hypsizygus marmoreus]|uniref:Uncharacterized protein n=1 Tax=Hypsizygus marmoreus TaxID=39966 RepID=A0A369KDR7_HYPMA|nr:hypothetical protein Hypma_013953 [Hypsizygus marmoreus]